MEQTILLCGGFFAVAITLLVILGAGDLRRRQLAERRRWLRDRYHAAMDRVEAFKLELEPPLDGLSGFTAVEQPPRPYGAGLSKTKAASDPSEPTSEPASAETRDPTAESKSGPGPVPTPEAAPTPESVVAAG